MSAAIFYHPEAYSTRGPKLMGRNAAGESFLRGFLSHGRQSAFYAQVDNADHGQQFAEAVLASGRSEPSGYVTRENLGALNKVNVVFHPGPVLGHHAWQRALFGHGGWSLCGITHTTSSAAAMDAIADLLTAPVQPWDALICTSTAVKANVVQVLQAQLDYLKDRFGVTKLVLPQLPVIPLGIHTQDFAFSAAARETARQEIGVDPGTIVVLFAGRLSFHAKAHPLAMYQALERVAEKTGQDILLVECGWHGNDHIRDAFAQAATIACPRVRTITLDGRSAANRARAWAGADLFISLSDNIQETFGITPIEAMAAGLPVIVTDWDGYKDTVRQGQDGYRVPTLMPQAGMGVDLARRHALQIDTYDRYCGNACMLVAVDQDALDAALLTLVASRESRATMGAAGQARARAIYDWSAIIPRYEALWSEQRELRRAYGPQLKRLAHPWPARLDPFLGFAAYPTRQLTRDTIFALVDADAETSAAHLARLQQLDMVSFAPLIMATTAEVAAMLDVLSSGPHSAESLIAVVDVPRRPFAMRSLVWLGKLGIIKLA
ncbi:MAG: glycosyltransferase family 4 protein [Sandarakinorhabdus sp.]